MSIVISSGILYLPIVCECVLTSLTFSIETGHSTHDQRSGVVSNFMSSHYIMYGFMEIGKCSQKLHTICGYQANDQNLS